MSDRDLSSYTEQDLLRDPFFDQSTLGHLATARPDLRPAILAHPNVYPELAEWLRAQTVQPPADAARPGPTDPAHDTAVGGAVGEQPMSDTVRAGEAPVSGGYGTPAAAPSDSGWGGPGASVPAQAGAASAGWGQPGAYAPAQAGAAPAWAGPPDPAGWSDAFRARTGREPSLAEYQAAVAAGQVAQGREDSWAKVSAGAAQVADGAKDFFQNRVAPAAQGAARDFQRAVGDAQATPFAKAVSIAGFVLPALALVAILPVFLPAVSISAMGMSESVSFWDSGEGVLLLIAFALTVAAGVTAIIVKALWARVTAACLGIGSALIGLIDSIAVMAGSGDLADLGGGMLEVSADVGFGVVLLLILSILMLLAGIAMLLPTRKKQPKAPANPWQQAAQPGQQAAPGYAPDAQQAPSGQPQQPVPGAPPAPGAPPVPGGPAQFGDYSRPPLDDAPYGQIPPRPQPPQAPRG